ncbi:hypothetical protein [Nonomuraea sp. NPDC050786]|uniref:hypothetical protein n=1 Tax=Nonomuraea sp. NPDC050786 TaxID=3154840 RepID=UPI0033FB43F1
MNRVEAIAQNTIPTRAAAGFQPLEHAKPVSPVLFTPVAAFVAGYNAVKFTCTFFGGDHLESTALKGGSDMTQLDVAELVELRRHILHT